MSDRLLFQGTPQQYVSYIRNTLLSYEKYFDGVYKAIGNAELDRLERNLYSYSLNGVKFYYPGEDVDVEEHHLFFRNGSFLMMNQTFHFSSRSTGCTLLNGNISFIHVVDRKVKYLFRYDTVEDIPDHPNHHLQFAFDRAIETPRFVLPTCGKIDDVLHMLIRDRIVE